MSEEARLTAVADGLFVWCPEGRGTWGLANCGLLVTEAQAVLVDTPYDLPRTRRLLAAAEPVLGPDRSIGTVLLTHSNGDHSYGLPALPGVEVIGTEAYLHALDHEPTPEQMHLLTRGGAPGEATGWYLAKHFGRYDFTGLEIVPPTRVFSGELDLDVDGTPVRLTQAGPAHTDGDLWVHLPEQGVVFAGDLVFAGDHPVHWAGPLASVIDGCERILGTGAEVIVPGHGPLLGPAGLRDYVDYLSWVAERCRVLRLGGIPAQDAALRLIDSGRYPELGLPERLAITVATEYRHLSGDQDTPDLVGLVGAAARIALARAEAAAAL
ncbi:MBL fold metallo-hydrolase [Streptacidiphilus sp. EB129]|uniref:MBL fold metallo-hydrolase n=1 Tax=Streptacidiphilus sp. EB129 TaxID=3156262 RepID=UPI003512B86C